MRWSPFFDAFQIIDFSFWEAGQHERKLEAIHSLGPAGRGERSAKYLEAKLVEMVRGGDWMMDDGSDLWYLFTIASLSAISSILSLIYT